MGGRSGSSGISSSIQDKINNMKSYPDADPGDVKNLVPLASESDIREASRLYNIIRSKGDLNYDEKEVSISSLTTRQEWVTQSKLSSMNEDFTGRISGLRTSTDSGVRAIDYNGKLILVDGNHRVNLAILRGQKRMKIRILKVK